MPTGYTADIKDGISFNQYAMACARAFGALVLMRDEPSDAPIPENIEPSDYHERKLSEAKTELKRLELTSIADANGLALEEWGVSEERRRTYLSENMQLRVKYNEMLDKVKTWNPPTEDHKGLHEFMRTQIEDSIKWDCNEESYNAPANVLPGEEWLNLKKENALRDISYHTKENNEEIKRTNGRNSWLKSLRDSLAV